MSKQDLLKVQSCILKVNIHCDGCEQKVKKLLHKIDGVYSVNIDAEQGKVFVAGNVDPAKLIKKLKRSGKHAEIWGGQRGMMYNQNYPFNNQFQNLQVGNNKGGKDDKSQNQKGQKGSVGGGHGQLAHLQNIKGIQDLKVPTKEHKSVKFNSPQEKFNASDDDSDEFNFNFDDYDDEEEEGHGHGHAHVHSMPTNKMIPVMGNGSGPDGPVGMMYGPALHNHKDNGGGWVGNYGSDQNGDVIDLVMQIKGKGGNSIEVKNGNKGAKKSDEDPRVKNKWDGVDNNHNKKKKSGKSEGGLLGRFLGFGKKSKMGEVATDTRKNNNNKNNVSRYNKGKEEEKFGARLVRHGDSKPDFDFIDIDIPSRHDKNGKSGKGSNGNGNGNRNGNVGQVGPMGMNGGGEFHQGMQMQLPQNNLQQQQCMSMMMNQQEHHHQANMNNNMYSPNMMYGRPHPYTNCMAPPPMPSHPMADPITHAFSDANVESCSVM